METAAFFRTLRQGDVLEFEDGEQHVIVSQTCDIVLAKREFILTAPVSTGLSDIEIAGAVDRTNPRYVFANDLVVDLAQIEYREKATLTKVTKTAGFDDLDDDSVRMFGLSIGRWFSRFAFPDEVHPWLDPLQRLIRSKYVKEASPLSTVLQSVVEVRIEAQQWAAQQREITIHIIVKADALEMLPAAPPSELDAEDLRTPNEVASAMVHTSPPYSNRLWDELADSMARVCVPKANQKSLPGVSHAVRSVVAEIWGDDEFPLVRYRKSEALDIEFLSDSERSLKATSPSDGTSCD